MSNTMPNLTDEEQRRLYRQCGHEWDYASPGDECVGCLKDSLAQAREELADAKRALVNFDLERLIASDRENWKWAVFVANRERDAANAQTERRERLAPWTHVHHKGDCAILMTSPFYEGPEPPCSCGLAAALSEGEGEEDSD